MDYKNLEEIAERFKAVEINGIDKAADGITEALVGLVKEIALKTIDDFVVFVKEVNDAVEMR